MAGAAVSPNPIPPPPSFLPSIKPRVIILGGTGRVGASTAAALSRLCPSVHLVVAGRNREKGATIASKLGEKAEFVWVNVDDIYSIQAALEGLKKMGNELPNHVQTLLGCFGNKPDKSYGEALKRNFI